jgi:hypothetical protein
MYTYVHIQICIYILIWRRLHICTYTDTYICIYKHTSVLEAMTTGFGAGGGADDDDDDEDKLAIAKRIYSMHINR